jgi:hypothetical protein
MLLTLRLALHSFFLLLLLGSCNRMPESQPVANPPPTVAPAPVVSPGR